MYRENILFKVTKKVKIRSYRHLIFMMLYFWLMQNNWNYFYFCRMYYNASSKRYLKKENISQLTHCTSLWKLDIFLADSLNMVLFRKWFYYYNILVFYFNITFFFSETKKIWMRRIILFWTRWKNHQSRTYFVLD